MRLCPAEDDPLRDVISPRSAPHYTENAVGGLPWLMELMTVIALGNLSFSLLCTFSTCGALYTYHQAHIWNAPTLSGLIQIG